jgi:hypothetical protein
MEEQLMEAWEELKRLEHIIYVSLKYTRTVDVLINALNRLVSTYDLIIEAYLKKARLDGKIGDFPKSPALRATKVRELFAEDEQLGHYLTFYAFLKHILKLPNYKKREEYRRHVTFIVELKNSTSEVKIDTLMNCEKYIHRFYRYARDSLLGVPVEEEL